MSKCSKQAHVKAKRGGFWRKVLWDAYDVAGASAAACSQDVLEMLHFLLSVAISYSVAYGICSFWKSTWVAFLAATVAFLTGWGGGVLLAGLASELGVGTQPEYLSLFGRGLWFALAASLYGIYRARHHQEANGKTPLGGSQRVIQVVGLVLVLAVLGAVLIATLDHKGAPQTLAAVLQTPSQQPNPFATPTSEPWKQYATPSAPAVAGKIEAENWSGNVFHRFDSTAEIESSAQRFQLLHEQRAWAAVVAWQADAMREGKPANEALYQAVGTVLSAYSRGEGVCRPGTSHVVTPSEASAVAAAGSSLTLLDCAP